LLRSSQFFIHLNYLTYRPTNPSQLPEISGGAAAHANAHAHADAIRRSGIANGDQSAVYKGQNLKDLSLSTEEEEKRG
jgi:hypothetical protein